MSLSMLDDLLESTLKAPTPVEIPEDQKILGKDAMVEEIELYEMVQEDGYSEYFGMTCSAEAAMDAATMDLDVLENTEAALEAVEASLQIEMQNGGLDVNGFKAHNLQLEAATLIIGGPDRLIANKDGDVELTHESFDDAGMRMANTEITHERMKERIERVGAVVSKALDALLEAFDRFNEQYIMGVARHKQRLESTKGIASSVKGKPQSNAVTFSGHKMLLNATGRAPAKTNEVFGIARRLKTFSKDKGLDDLVAQMAALAGSATIDENNPIKQLVERFRDLQRQFDAAVISAVVATEDIGVPDRKELRRLGFGRLKRGAQGDTQFKRFVKSSAFTGGKAIYVAVPGDNSSMTVSVVFANDKRTFDAAKDMPALADREILNYVSIGLDILGEVEHAGNANRRTSKAFRDLNRSMKNMTSLLKDAISAGDVGEQERLKDIIKDIRKMATTVSSVNRSMMKYGVDVAAACNNYAAVSIKNLA